MSVAVAASKPTPVFHAWNIQPNRPCAERQNFQNCPAARGVLHRGRTPAQSVTALSNISPNIGKKNRIAWPRFF